MVLLPNQRMYRYYTLFLRAERDMEICLGVELESLNPM